MANTITDGQQVYLDGLRTGDPGKSEITITGPPLSASAQARLQARFSILKTFLIEKGHLNLQPEDLYLTVSREAFVSMLQYADDRRCLLLQCCFGMNIPPIVNNIELIPPGGVFRRELREVGRVLLINKGNFQELDGRSDDAFFNEDTVFVNQAGFHELFLNMDINQPLSKVEASEYIGNFRAMYPIGHNPFTFGYPLPVKALLQVINDQSTALGSAGTFTLRWGLTSSDDNDLGNFTLTIGTSNLSMDIGTGGLFIDPVIWFTSDTVHAAAAGNTPCPPTPGCR